VIYLEQALQINLELADKQGQAVTLGHLAAALEGLGNISAAIDKYEQRLRLACELGDRRSEAMAAWNLGKLLELQGEVERGFAYLEMCLNYERDTSDPAYEQDQALVQRLRARHSGKLKG